MNDCAPVSALQSFRKGGSEMQHIYSMLPGSNFDDKCTLAVKRWGKLPSALVPDRSRFFQGMQLRDVAAFCNDILREHGTTSVCFHNANRDVVESEDLCIVRIHNWLKESIDKGFPALATVALLRAELNEVGELGDWKSVTGHAFAISKVPETLRKNQLGFAFEFLGPDDIVFDGYLSFEHLRKYPDSFQGKRWEYNYISVFSRQLHLRQQNIEPHVRTVVLLTELCGRFEDGLKNRKRPERMSN
jgi:hypothetical protein